MPRRQLPSKLLSLLLFAVCHVLAGCHGPAQFARPCSGTAKNSPASTQPSDLLAAPFVDYLADSPAPPYHRQFNTLADYMLDVDSQARPQPDAKYQVLDSIFADAKKRIVWNPAETDLAKRRAAALAALRTIDRILLEHNVIYPPTGDIDTMGEGLDPHILNREDIMGAFAHNSKAFHEWFPDHRAEPFYYMDCDILTFVYLSIGEVTGIPLHSVSAPDHAFVRFYLSPRDSAAATPDPAQPHLDWEATTGQESTDQRYLKEFDIPAWSIRQRAYMADMTPRQILGYYLSCRATWEAALTPPLNTAAALDNHRAIDLYPECEIPRNNLAWLYVSVPGIRDCTKDETLQLALSAMAILPTDSAITDTVACAYAEVGDFDLAISFENDAIRLNDLDKSGVTDTAAIHKDLAARLGLFKDHKTYLESLAATEPAAPVGNSSQKQPGAGSQKLGE